MVQFNQLPTAVQQAIQAHNPQRGSDDLDAIRFYVKEAEGHNATWAAPSLCYDFHESNYTIVPVNLTVVASLDVGPAMVELYQKTDSTLPAWIIVDPDEGDTDFQIIECV